MSQGSFGPSYSLYGVISHAGGGPNSGHYYAHIKDSSGRWHEMNDESVSSQSSAPLGMKNAYILFYVKEKGQELDAAVATVNTPAPVSRKTGVVAGMKRKKTIESDDEDDEGARPPTTPTGRFIGPLLPSPIIDVKAAESRPDPQAELLKRKIAETKTPGSPAKPASPSKPTSPVKPSAALQSLAQYADDSESDDVGEKVEEKADPKRASPAPPPPAAEKLLPSLPYTPPLTTPVKKRASPGPVPVASFYASTSQQSKRKDDLKRKTPEPEDADEDLSQYARTPLSHASNFERSRGSSERKPAGFNPFSSRMRNDLHSHSTTPVNRYGKNARRRPRAL